MELSILEIILCIFILTIMVTVLFRKLKLSVILGYLLVGTIVGPNALGIAHNTQYAKSLAEFGIVFLMFTIGLEFSLPRLFALRKAVFIIGGLQVLLTILITAIIGILLGMTKLSAVAVGSIVAMSSTAIVMKQLKDQRELHSTYGLNAVGILLFQDLAVIPIIILIAGLAHPNQELSSILLWAVGKGIVAILLIFMLGRWVMQPLFRIISKTGAVELFTLTVLLVTLTSAWLTNQFGLSFALGAFLAGLMLAETEFRHQIEFEIRPFRDLLLGFFFITIGMLADFHSWLDTWVWILLLVFAIIIGKMLLVALITYLTQHKTETACRTGLVMAQGGEFGFAILTLALSNQILPQDYGQVVLAALLISIALSPLIIRYNATITAFLLNIKKSSLEQTMHSPLSDLANKQIALDASFYQRIRPILITEDTFAVNKRLGNLHLNKTQIELLAIRRSTNKHVKPHDELILLPEDILIIYGSEEQLEAAERCLIDGS